MKNDWTKDADARSKSSDTTRTQSPLVVRLPARAFKKVHPASSSSFTAGNEQPCASTPASALHPLPIPPVTLVIPSLVCRMRRASTPEAKGAQGPTCVYGNGKLGLPFIPVHPRPHLSPAFVRPRRPRRSYPCSTSRLGLSEPRASSFPVPRYKSSARSCCRELVRMHGAVCVAVNHAMPQVSRHEWAAARKCGLRRKSGIQIRLGACATRHTADVRYV
ncbi:hypothetical protein B0H16DRAFT_1892325 [Mycena metata]|uniref:Uncharacterized protein n=1 Tax=Mycena metata TaxID=1033252 RepID=A0AAD7I657_9AGAR|nr:hypothetical protein B0H16DRAFT_1892325 [Mycena metata]